MNDTTLATAVPHDTDIDDRLLDAGSTATRHLCTGVYVDRSFRDLVIRRIYNDARHRIAPSYGFDLVPVVRHARRSWLLEIGQLLAMLGVLITGLLTSEPLATVIVACAVLSCRLLTGIARELPDVFHGLVRTLTTRLGLPVGTRRRTDPDPRSRKRRIKVMFVCLLATLMVPPVLSYFLGSPITSALVPAAVIGSGLIVCAFVAGILRQALLISLVGTTRPHTLTRREEIIDEQQRHPCVIFQRPPHREGSLDPLELLKQTDKPSPFVGSGKLVNHWQLGSQLLRPGEGSMEEREYITPPFTAHQLVEALRVELKKLALDTGRESLPGLRVRDRIYIAANDLPADGSLTRRGLGKLEIRDRIDDHRLPGHHFLETSVPIVGGELVATVLIQVSLKGRSLSLDVATCALTRTPETFHVPDWYGEHNSGALLRSAARHVAALPTDVMRIWRLLEIPVVVVGARRARRDHTTVPRRRSVGPDLALREEIADSWDNAQLDSTTIYDHMKIVELRILKATEDFLRKHEVDTSAFEKKATNIINSGVLNMGASQMTVQQMVAGMGAQLNNNANAGGNGEGAVA
ncbi:hypothetical protein [Actinophytocola sp.]|uniref:hypothetical protein n=1 Tax=Actinophytocola sp. TaxID=1872138 RepID=UPI002D353A58|nr:hypothetical protein [Actinophytocola sp.]HYQ68935.1 hypothetical protein [Actinophytocola sp.]